MNLVKELHAIAKSNYEADIRESERALQSVKDNLSNEDISDKKMLKFFGTGQELPFRERSIKAHKQNMKNEWVRKDDVKTLCIKYHLRFLPAALYKKNIPTHALNDLRKFKTERNMPDECLQKGLMMIAPADHFALGKRPKNDPVLLWKDDNNFYKIITQWGNDFTWLRIAKAWAYRLWAVLIPIPLIALCFKCVKEMDKYEYSFQAPDHLFILSIVTGIAGGLFFIFGLIKSFDPNSSWDEPYRS